MKMSTRKAKQDKSDEDSAVLAKARAKTRARVQRYRARLKALKTKKARR